jgi:hypothetical protein
MPISSSIGKILVVLLFVFLTTPALIYAAIVQTVPCSVTVVSSSTSSPLSSPTPTPTPTPPPPIANIVNGIENVVKFDDWKTKGNSPFSIQQNFYVANSKGQRYFVQNIIMFVPIGNAANEYNGYGGFEIYNFTGGGPPQAPLEKALWTLKNKLVAWVFTANHAVSTSVEKEVTLRSSIEDNKLVMENDFHERYTWSQDLDSTYYIGKLAEIVIVGTSTNAQVDFEYGTKGYVDTYVRLSSNSQTWFYGKNQVVKFSTNTAENSRGLQWTTNGVFQYGDAWTDQGLNFEANTEMPASPPEVQQSSQSGTALVLGMHSPATINLYDASGRHTGFNAETGKMDMEIPKSLLFYSDRDQYIMVFDPAEPYKLLVTGTDTGDYMLDAYYRKDGNVELLYNSSAAIQKGATSEYAVETLGDKFAVASAFQNQPILTLELIVAIVVIGVVAVSIIGSVVFVKRRKTKQNSIHALTRQRVT